MADNTNEDAPVVDEAVAFDSDKAITACYGILASVAAAQEAMNEAVQGRFAFQARQRILAAGLEAAGKPMEMPWETQRRSILSGGVVTASQTGGDETMRRDEIEALIAHKTTMNVDKALADMASQTGDVREAVEQAISQQSSALEAKLLNIMRENLTDSLRTLEETLEERMREIASAAAERERVNKALDEARKAAEQGIRAAGGDELLDQIEDVRDVRLDVGDLFVGDIEERSSVTDELPPGSIEEVLGDEEIEVGEEIEAGGEEEEIEAGEAEEDDVVEAGEDDEEIEAGEDDEEIAIEADEADEEDVVIEAGEADEEDVVIEAGEEEEEIEADDGGVEIDLGDDDGEVDAVEIDVGGDDVDLDMDEDDVEISQGLGPSLDDSAADVVVMDSKDAGDEADEEVEIPIVEDFPDEDEEAIGRYLELAYKLRDRKNYSAATELYNKVLELEDGNVEARIGLGQVHLQTPDFEAAATEFGKALELAPENPMGFLGMGEVHFLQKDYAAAIKQYSKCVKLDDDLALAYCNRGLSYYYRKNHKKAFLDLQKAYRLDPDIPNIKKYLQMVMKVLKKKDKK